MQIKDFFGLPIAKMPEHYTEKISLLIKTIKSTHWPMQCLSITLVTSCFMLLWPRLKILIPPYLPAVIVGSIAALLLNQTGFSVDTIGSRFTYLLTARGI